MDGGSSNPESVRPWLALNRIPGFGPKALESVLPQIDSPADLFSLSVDDLRACGLNLALVRALREPDWRAVDRDCRWLEQSGHHLLSFKDAHYPCLLHEISDPPLLLFIKGDPDCLAAPQLGIVGSRNPTPDGRRLAREFAARLGRLGLTINSGLAMGIDAAAHEGALQAGAKTLAVFGCGPDRIYPKTHARLAARVEAHGALVSEFPPGTPPLAVNFPRRNRIISGLSLGILVVEAAMRSGSLITARCATEQGREVFAVPGTIHNPQARGCHHLIRQGAKLVETEQDILEELGPLLHVDSQAISLQPNDPAPGDETELPQNCRQLLDVLGDSPASVDILVERSGLTADAVSSILLLLELRGLIAPQPGGTYVRLRQR